MGCNKIRKLFRFTLYTFSRAGFKVDGEVRGSKWRSANCTRCLKRGCVLGKRRTTVDLAHSAPRNLAPRRSNQQIPVQILRRLIRELFLLVRNEWDGAIFYYFNLNRCMYALSYLIMYLMGLSITFVLSFTPPYKECPRKTG